MIYIYVKSFDDQCCQNFKTRIEYNSDYGFQKISIKWGGRNFQKIAKLPPPPLQLSTTEYIYIYISFASYIIDVFPISRVTKISHKFLIASFQEKCQE